MEFLEQMFRVLMFALDNIVYSLISNAYQLIIYLSNLDLITSNEVLNELINRVYLLLGIFMLFKVSFSMIQYLIDPNSFSDRSKGFGKLVTNTLVAVILLVSVPFIFNEAYKLQELIIDSEIINKLILGSNFGDNYVGTDVETENTNDKVRQMATDVQFTMFSAFYTLNTKDDTSGIIACKPGENGNGRNSDVIGSLDMAKSSSCLQAFADAADDEMNRYGAKIEDFFKTADSDDDDATIHDNREFSSLGKLLYWKKGGSGTKFTINYTPIISTLAGGYLLLLLVTFAIDIAARALKLMFLQAVAPIAIVSYIDPKESASQGKLHSWVSDTLKTYASLFLRLAIIFLALRLIQMITSMIFYPVAGNEIVYYNNVQPEGTMNMFVYVFLILGIFTFAKQVPKMIEGIFGIKMTGEMNLNPFKALKENPATAFAGGLGFGTAGGLAAGIKGAIETGDKKALLAGLVSGAKFGVQNRGKNGVLGNAMNNAYKDVTGNEMKRMNLARSIMGVGASSRIDDLEKVKDKNEEDKAKIATALKTAESDRKAAYTRANDIARAASNADSRRANAKSKLDEAKKKSAEALRKVAEAEKASKTSMPHLNNKFANVSTDDLNKRLANGYNPEVQAEINARAAKEKIEADLDRAYKAQTLAQQAETSALREYSAADSDYKKYSNALPGAQAAYQEALDYENELSKAIIAIDKDQEVIKGQIKEERMMGNLDPTPKERVAKARDTSSKRDVDSIINRSNSGN